MFTQWPTVSYSQKSPPEKCESFWSINFPSNGFPLFLSLLLFLLLSHFPNYISFLSPSCTPRNSQLVETSLKSRQTIPQTSKANRSIKHDKCCAWSSTTSRRKDDRLKKVKNLIRSRFLAVPEFFRKQFILAIYVTHLARFLVGLFLRHPGACCWVYTEHNVQPLHAPEWLIFGTALGDHLADEIPSRCLSLLPRQYVPINNPES